MKKRKFIVLALVLSLLFGTEAFAAVYSSDITDKGIEELELVPVECMLTVGDSSTTPSNAQQQVKATLKLVSCPREGSEDAKLESRPAGVLTPNDRYRGRLVWVDGSGKEITGTSSEAIQVTLRIPGVTPSTFVGGSGAPTDRTSQLIFFDGYGVGLDQYTRQNLTVGDGAVSFSVEAGKLPASFYITVDRGATTNNNTSSNTGNSSGSSSSSGSHSSGRPEAYSRGETLGDLRVEKRDSSARVIKANGEEADVIVHPFITAGTRTFTQAQAQRILGTKSQCGIYAFDLCLVNASEDYSVVTLKEGSVTVTFYVPGVTPQSNVVLRHWINGSNTYEDLPVTLGDGTVTATFSSFSPVVILVAQDGVPTGTSASPRTGETSLIYLVEVIALLSAIGFVVCRKKARR